ncbi:MAG: ornithine cyclodeaminase family protein, partial [Pseudomonadota bacterium]
MLLQKPDIMRLLDLRRAAEAIRRAYIATAQGAVQAPDVTYLGFPDAPGDCHVKTAHMRGAPHFVIKVATGFYANPAKGLPSSNGINLLFSASTGELVATLQDEGWLTDMRTGLGGALATYALARPGFDQVLIVGTGIQARVQARCLHDLRSDPPIHVAVWGRRAEAAETAAQ